MTIYKCRCGVHHLEILRYQVDIRYHMCIMIYLRLHIRFNVISYEPIKYEVLSRFDSSFHNYPGAEADNGLGDGCHIDISYWFLYDNTPPTNLPRHMIRDINGQFKRTNCFITVIQKISCGGPVLTGSYSLYLFFVQDHSIFIKVSYVTIIEIKCCFSHRASMDSEVNEDLVIAEHREGFQLYFMNGIFCNNKGAFVFSSEAIAYSHIDIIFTGLLKSPAKLQEIENREFQQIENIS